MKIAFSTLCCIDYSVEQIVELCKKTNVFGVELRLDLNGAHKEMDFNKAHALFENAGITVTDIASSIFVRASDFDEGWKRYVDAAAIFNAKGVRVFVGDHGKTPYDEVCLKVPTISAAIKNLCRYAKEKGVEIWIETHSEFSTGKAVKKLIEEVNEENLKVIWDVMHSLEFNEEIGETVSYIGSSIVHLHFKDGVPNNEGFEFKHTDLGAGIMPFKETVDIMKSVNFNGYLSLEWESPWRPEIRELYPDPAVLIEKYIGILKESGV
jgi:sugar phosphate isomerase/epimerase